MDKYYIPWSEVECAANTLATDMLSKGVRIDGVCGIARGGLVPAVLVARRLKVRRVASIQVEGYDDEATSPGDSIHIVDKVSRKNFKGKWLFIDYIIASGRTMQLIADTFPGHYYTAMFFVSDMQIPTFRGYVFPRWPALKGVWMVFPWERER